MLFLQIPIRLHNVTLPKMFNVNLSTSGPWNMEVPLTTNLTIRGSEPDMSGTNSCCSVCLRRIRLNSECFTDQSGCFGKCKQHQIKIWSDMNGKWSTSLWIKTNEYNLTYLKQNGFLFHVLLCHLFLLKMSQFSNHLKTYNWSQFFIYYFSSGKLIFIHLNEVKLMTYLGLVCNSV